MVSRCVCQSAPVRALVVPVCCERGLYFKNSPVRLMATVGTLLGMCSRAEAAERQAFRELSVLEQLAGTERDARPAADPRLVVKRYQRPAAGAPPPSASELRPKSVLNATTRHLLGLWTSRTDVPAAARCAFISDRLRAVLSQQPSPPTLRPPTPTAVPCAPP